jgi:hypothetical protein
MIPEIDLEKRIDDESRYIEGNSVFSFDEARASLERAVKYFMDMGSGPEPAWDQAIDLVASAVVNARNCGFGLKGTVDYMLFSRLHRVQSSCKF